MPVYHVHASFIKQGQGSAAGFASYLARENRADASTARRYIDRELDGSGKDDLIAQGSGNLPPWAHGSAALLWEAADVLERKNGTVARQLELALPRELSPHGREALAADIREVLMGTEFAHSWAIHEPQARDGSGIMPHMHVLFSPRRQADDQARKMATWFKQVNHGGVKPDESWKTKGRLHDVRAMVSLLSNAALAREGLDLAVDHRSLAARGIDRDPARYQAGDQADEARTLAYRRGLRESGALAYEQLATYGGWQDQAVKLISLDRQYVKDLARDHVWRYDQSPGRTLERQQSMARTLDRAMEGKEQTRPRTLERSPAREHQRAPVRHRLRQMAGELDRMDDTPRAGVAMRIKLGHDEQEQGRDLSW